MRKHVITLPHSRFEVVYSLLYMNTKLELHAWHLLKISEVQSHVRPASRSQRTLEFRLPGKRDVVILQLRSPSLELIDLRWFVSNVGKAA